MSIAHRDRAGPPSEDVFAGTPPGTVPLSESQIWVVRVIAALVGAAATVVLVDWWMGGDGSVRGLIPPSLGQMRPMTAVCFLSVAVGLEALLGHARWIV